MVNPYRRFGTTIDPIFKGQDIQKYRLSVCISCVTTKKSADLKPGFVTLHSKLSAEEDLLTMCHEQIRDMTERNVVTSIIEAFSVPELRVWPVERIVRAWIKG